MYDPLKHYIAEGLVVVHCYPSPDDWRKNRGRYFSAPNVEIEPSGKSASGNNTGLRVKHGNVWFKYDTDDDFWDEYTVRVRDRFESEEIETKWKKELAAARELVGDIV
jgi:hypothetical protein